MFFETPTNLFPVIIISIEAVLLLFQVSPLFVKPEDEKQKWFLWILLFLLTYNIWTEFVIHYYLLIPLLLRHRVGHLLIITISFCVVCYCYKVHLLYGARLFAKRMLYVVITSYLFSFGLVYFLSNSLSEYMHMIVPSSYSIVSLITIIGGLLFKNNEEVIDAKLSINSHLPVIVALFCLALLPMMELFHLDFFIRIVVNAAFLLITITNISLAIMRLRREQIHWHEQISTFSNLSNEALPALEAISLELQNLKVSHSLTNDVQKLETIATHISKLSLVLQKFKLQKTNITSHVNISVLIKKKIQLLAPMAKRRAVIVKEDLPIEHFLAHYPAHLDRIISTQLENIIRDTQEFGLIHISLKEDAGILSLMINDNGITIAVELSRKVSHDLIPPVNNPLSETSPKSVTGPRRPYILLIESTQSALKMVQAELETKFNTNLASGSAAALEILRTRPHVDLIICDRIIEEFRYELIKMEDYKTTPFIVLADEKATHNWDAKMNYLVKPIDITELISTVEALTDTISTETETLREVFGSLKKTPEETVVNQVPHPFQNTFEYNCWKCELTPREIEMVQLLNQGKSHQEIGDHLFISKKTVDTHVNNIFKKIRKTFNRSRLKGRVDLLNILEIRSAVNG